MSMRISKKCLITHLYAVTKVYAKNCVLCLPGSTYFNPKEVKLTLELVQLVIDKYRSISQTLRGVVGVITPYSGQKFQIRQALRKRNLSKLVFAHNCNTFIHPIPQQYYIFVFVCIKVYFIFVV